MRPLALQNTNGKVMAVAAARALTPAFQASATCEQRGLIPVSSLVQNVVELDLEARKLAINADAISFLALLFFDFAAAFPSVPHVFMHMVLEAEGFPDGLRSMVRALYSGWLGRRRAATSR